MTRLITHSLPISSQNNSANSDNFVSVGVNSTPSNREVQNEEEVEDPLNERRSPANETCLQSVIPDYAIITEEHNSNSSTGREIYNIAPGESKHPVSLMIDKQCEELALHRESCASHTFPSKNDCFSYISMRGNHVFFLVQFERKLLQVILETIRFPNTHYRND